MNHHAKPLIYLLNTDVSMSLHLKSKKFNAHHNKMNGYEEINPKYRTNFLMPYTHFIPLTLHESEIIVIDTSSRKGLFSEDNSTCSIYYRQAPNIVNFLPLDICIAIQNAFKTNKNQIIIFFASEFSSYEYILQTNDGNKDIISCDSLWLPYNTFTAIHRSGTRISTKKGNKDNEIKNYLNKFLSGSNYHVIFETYRSDSVLAVNEVGEAVSIIRRIGNKTIMVFPDIVDKKSFICELFEKVLPELPDYKDLFPSNDNFSWTKEFSYISIEERNKIIDIENEIKRHEENMHVLNKEYDTIHNDAKNMKLRNLLKETGDELVLSVKWFLEYIGFNNVIDPDKDVDIDSGEIFEEDLNFEYDGMNFILEVKGIGGTSTDAQCAQISKIALRRKKANQGKSHKAIYIVNHQRYRAPKERSSTPFNNTQIEDAEMAQRGMTFTYELFNIYHMIEAGIISKFAVREAFKQEGLINFRHSLHMLTYNHLFKGPTVYSLIIPEGSSFTVTKADKIAIQDNESHWHLLSIENIQVDNQDCEEVSAGKAGFKVDRIVPEARDFYVVKTNDFAV